MECTQNGFFSPERDVVPNMAHRFRRLDSPVVQAYPGLPAAESGISGAYRNARGEVVLGDIITHIDDKPIRNHDDYFSALEARDPGDTVRITTRLGEKTPSYEVVLIESQ